MARSARELFEEATRLDPEERATLMRFLIESLDAESEEGVEDAWRVEIERRISESGVRHCALHQTLIDARSGDAGDRPRHQSGEMNELSAA